MQRLLLLNQESCSVDGIGDAGVCDETALVSEQMENDATDDVLKDLRTVKQQSSRLVIRVIGWIALLALLQARFKIGGICFVVSPGCLLLFNNSVQKLC
ncbi:hypothetical protein RB195_009757 [Necator americanus]|uniref:Uncharacterized protein n=1 Tax=Necator americanus TaxID=51031 RepID=A0ABR1CUS8_NECAM